ncbi:MAG TPA: hypothetical protein VJ553_04565, partial [Candidatus Paceibacterota bacterium]|nr:hypothetical protein [Candidatus Paceibacterota bacterium]
MTAVDVNGAPFDTVTLTLPEDPPRAQLISPSDGLRDPEDEFEDDFHPDPKQLLVTAAPESFVIQLMDSEGIDDDSADNGDVVTLTRNEVLMPQSPSSYTFAYNDQTHEITLSAPTNETFDTGLYQITLSGGEAKIMDTQQREMLPTVLTVRVEPSWESVDLVPVGSTWEYLVTPSEPVPDGEGDTWRDPAFDHSWSSGAAELGYGDGDEATELTYGGDSEDKYITTYFRHTFEVDENSNLFDLLGLSLLRDDGAVMYLNGTEVRRSNMPTGTIEWETRALAFVAGDAEKELFAPYLIDKALLVEDENVLAVEIHQFLPNSSDISFNLKLTAWPSQIIGSFEDGVLRILGSTVDDSIVLSANALDHVTLNGQELSGPVDADEVEEIRVYGYAGDDTIDLSGVTSAVFSHVNLQASGAIRIEGGAGDDELVGSDDFGDTYVFSGSGLGNDSINLTGGVSYLQDNDIIQVAPDSVATVNGDLVLAQQAGYHVQLNGPDKRGLLTT